MKNGIKSGASTPDSCQEPSTEMPKLDSGTTKALFSSSRKERKVATFDERFEDLLAFKEKHGHCNPPSTPSSEYASLGKWANHVRLSYRQIQSKNQPHIRLTDEHIKRLTDLGFVWKARKKSFEVRFQELVVSRKNMVTATFLFQDRVSILHLENGVEDCDNLTPG